MPSPPPPDYTPGAQFSASWLTRFLAFLKSLVIIPDHKTIEVTQTPDGQRVRAILPLEADFRVTGGAQPYSGVESWATSPGMWGDRPGGQVVTLGLYERNGNTAVAPNAIVRARLDSRMGQWIFDRATCSGGTVTNPPSSPVTPPATTSPTSPAPSPSPTTTPTTTSPAPTPGGGTTTTPTPPPAPTTPGTPSPDPGIPPGAPAPIPYPPPSLPRSTGPAPTMPVDPPAGPVDGPPSSPIYPPPGGGLPREPIYPPPGYPIDWPGTGPYGGGDGPPPYPGPYPVAGPSPYPVAFPLPGSPPPPPPPSAPSTPQNTIQTVVANGAYPTANTWQVVLSGHASSSIPFGANAATVTAAIEAITGVGTGNVTVTGNPSHPTTPAFAMSWTLEFVGALAGTDVPTLVQGVTSAGDNLTITKTQTGHP